MPIRRTIENGVYVYHVAEAYPRGDVDEIRLWRTDRGYFAEIAHRDRESAAIPFHEYSGWGELKGDVMRCLYELRYPAFEGESELRPPLLRRIPG